MDTLDPFRKYARVLAVCCSIASAVLTGIFAWHQGSWWLVSLACCLFLIPCSLASDYLHLLLADKWRNTGWPKRIGYALGVGFIFALNVISNVGSVGWQRDSTANTAKMEQAVYQDRRSEVAENKRLLEAHSKRLAELEATNAWSTSVNAAALRAQLESANLAIEQEARRGGCGRLCLERTRERDELMARIAVAEDMSETRRQIAGLKATLAKSRDVAANTDAPVAASVSQAAFFASMGTISLKPSDESQIWTDRIIATMIALGLCVFTIILSKVGWESNPAPPTIRRTEPETPAEPIRPAYRHRDYSLNTVTIKDLKRLAAA